MSCREYPRGHLRPLAFGGLVTADCRRRPHGCPAGTAHLRDFPATELEEVLALEGAAVLASVGGYRLEGPSIRLFEAVRGDYFTILGLPLLPLLAALRRYAPDAFSARASA